MMVTTKLRIDIAKRQTAEVRRYIDEMRLRIARLRGNGADATAAESQLATMLPVVERFEAYVDSMQQMRGTEKTLGG